MAARMPVVFISHGAPDALLTAPDAVACWREIGQSLPPPRAILVISAHWEAHQPTASLSGAPETIHDFSGFAPQLKRMQYPAPGAPALAKRAVALLRDAGIAAELHPNRGLDHGSWVPLSALYPQASVPVTQLSLIHNGSAAQHVALGQALTPLRDEGVLIVTTGAITHNFAWLDWNVSADTAVVPQARVFADWVGAQLDAHNAPALMAYRSTPLGVAAHPTEEHFLPLFVGIGAAGEDAPQRYQPSFSYGGLAMDAYVWVHPPSEITRRLSGLGRIAYAVRRKIMRLGYLVSIVLCAASWMLASGVSAVEPADPRPMVKVEPGGRYKVVYDIHDGDLAAGVSKGLYYARGLIEAFGKQGVKPAQLDIHLVLHGEAAQYLLIDETYQKAVKDPFAVNLNAKITQDLLDRGVSVEICHSVMKSKDWKPEDVLPGVTIVHDGYTRLIKLQNDGYAYIGGF